MENESLIEQAKENLTESIEHWAPIYEEAEKDLHFMSDEEGAQWDPKDYAARMKAKKPALTIDQLEQFVNRVTNDIRMNTPVIKVSPTGALSSVLESEVIQGMVRKIEQKSRADVAYDTAATFAVESSIGYFRVDHDYVNIDSFEQEMSVNRIVNPHYVFPDPDTETLDGSDYKYCHVIQPITIEEFEDNWPDKEPVGLDCPGLPVLIQGKELYISEYFKLVTSPATLYRLRDGQEGVIPGEPDPESMGDVVMTRPTEIRTIKRCWMSGAEILEETTVPGQFIPIIPVYGKERWVKGERKLHSLIRKSKDSQRMYNYFKSMETELIMKQPKAPVIAAEGTIENYADLYMNPDGTQVLLYEPFDEQGRALPAPEIGNVPRFPDTMSLAARSSVDDIKASMGLYGANLGQRTNETSGKAISERKAEGDLSTFHYGDNLLHSIQQAGRIIVTSLPEVYSGPRIVPVLGREETSEMVGINGALAPGQQETVWINRGSYEVTVTTGAPFATMREEAADFYKQVVMTSPEQMPIMGDLMFRAMDFPGAQAVADRLERLLPPEVRGGQEQGPTPEQQQIMQMEQALQQMQAANAQLEERIKAKDAEVQLKAQTEMAKNDTERQKQQVEVMRLSLEKEQMKADLAIQQQELNVKREELDLRRQELSIELIGKASAGNGQPT